jgi:poly(beta-D-mannuronate) lyase
MNRNLNYLIILIFFISSNLLGQQYFNNASALESAVNNATNGGVFIVTNGTYNDFDFTIQNSGTSSSPIIIKAESVGGVELTGESHVVFKKSAHCVLEGFDFDSECDETLVKLEGCHHIRITRNEFELTTTESIKWIFIGGVWNDNVYPFQYPSHHNTIDRNTFKNKNTPGHYITIDGSHDDTGSDEVYYQSTYDVIRLNHFKNNGPRAVNEQESIRIGWSEMSLSNGYTLVEQNLFEDCDGDPEIISVKSCNNTIRHNTFRSSYGTLSLRHGNNNLVEGNYFFGENKPVGTSPAGSSLFTGGIRIYGANHTIINNYMEGLNGTRWDAPITLTLGDAINGQSSNLSKHFRAENVVIAHNTLVNNEHGIEIGYDNNNQYSKDLSNITIANNIITGSENGLVEIVDVNNDQGNNITWKDNLFFPIGNAVVLKGATSTNFDTTNAKIIQPYLIFDSINNVYSATDSTPVFLTYNGVSILHDIQGEPRPSNSNPGADHFLLNSSVTLFGPLSPLDVGPGANMNLTAEELTFIGLKIAPNPASYSMNIEQIPEGIQYLQILNQKGQLMRLLDVEGKVSINYDISALPSGIYYIRFQGNCVFGHEKFIKAY